MIVITRNGKTTVITGWREWLLRAVVFVVTILVLAVVFFFMLGLAVTLGAIAMILIPAAIIVGLLGSMFVQGQGYGKLTVLFEGGLAFEGILVAIVARSRPLAVPIVALFYGYLRQGAQLMNIRTDVPAEVIDVVTAIIILLVSSSFSLNFITRLFKRSPSPATAPAAVGGAAK